MNYDRKWWKEAVVYQIYPKSFQDSNGDGIGDLNGIISRLDEIRALGIQVIWLSPVYKSPNIDNGYDISDYRSIHPDYGNMDDMERLIREAQARQIKIIMDLVINHTSDQHPWFQASRDPQSPYRDYYYWRQSVNGELPNNWTSFFGEKCWEYDNVSGEYYLHLFAKEQPDLNYHNAKVLAEIKDIMRFWLDKGIAGFRCDVINIIYKSSLDNGKKKMILTGSEHYLSQEGNHAILRELRHDVLKDYDCMTVGETVFVTPEMGNALCAPEREELDMIFSFEHMETDQFLVKWFKRKFNPELFAKVISKWQVEVDWNAIYLENHDQPRSVSRFGNEDKYWEKSSKLLATMLLTLKGTPFIYQGQEIGMTNFDYADMSELKDVESFNIARLATRLHIPKAYIWKMMKRCSRDNARTPMQWTREENAGFSEGVPWIKINKNHTKINYQDQDNSSNSVLNYYRKMIALRANNQSLIYGNFKLHKTTKGIFIYSRHFEKEVITIILNFSKRTHTVNTTGSVLISNYDKQYFDGILLPYEAVVLKSKA
ncbi:alpha-glucosidase [Fusibacter bizertensis]